MLAVASASGTNEQREQKNNNGGRTQLVSSPLKSDQVATEKQMGTRELAMYRQQSWNLLQT